MRLYKSLGSVSAAAELLLYLRAVDNCCYLQGNRVEGQPVSVEKARADAMVGMLVPTLCWLFYCACFEAQA